MHAILLRPAPPGSARLPTRFHPFDARGVAQRFRHAAVFGAVNALRSGDAIRFVDGHDALPGLDQVAARGGKAVSVAYRQQEPGAIVTDFAKAG